jgi:uncharacterized protein YbjT (DUF2867 family)
MKIVVIGGSGLIGSKLVEKLRDAGHDPLPASPDSGVNTLTGEGLADALEGAQVVVDVSNSPVMDDAGVMEFFQTSSRNLLAAEKAAGVNHHVVLSIVGADRLQESGYLRAKVAQEQTVEAGGIRHTILRASQFFEFLGRLADSSAEDGTVYLPHVLVQPEAADDVAATLCEIAVGEPQNAVIELGGPDQFWLDEIVGRVLRAQGDARSVTADASARYFGAELDEHSLIPAQGARIAQTRFDDWFSRSLAARAAA